MNKIKTTISAVVIIICFAVITVVGLDALDRSIYPGCKVIDQQADVLIIKLDPEFDEPTDFVCSRFGNLVYQIARDGYQVQVANGHFASLGVITREQARRLAKGY